MGLVVGALTWLACLAVAFGALQRYTFDAGRAGKAADGAADFLAKQRAPGRALIVMATHPRCPCTRASFGELSDLLVRSPGNCDVTILEYTPKDSTADWPTTAATRQLGPFVARVIPDLDGTIAASLGGHTSGHVVFVDPQGAIRFQGGLTIGRGHRGRSPAQDAILAILNGREPVVASAPVFGCGLEPVCKAPLTP